MHRFYLPSEECRGPSLTLRGGEAHHGLRVLRVRTGDRVVVLNGVGGVMDCVVSALGKDSIQLTVVKRVEVPAPVMAVTLIQAVPKGKLIESITQKATELGAARIVPVLSERVVMQLDGEGAASKQEHWQASAREAIKQCGQPWLPVVELPVRLGDLLRCGLSDELSFVASLQPGTRHPRVWFDEFRAREGRLPASVCVAVGPEGDFTPAEVEALIGAGASPITLGPLVLRCETAATYCLSVLSYERQSRGA